MVVCVGGDWKIFVANTAIDVMSINISELNYCISVGLLCGHGQHILNKHI